MNRNLYCIIFILTIILTACGNDKPPVNQTNSRSEHPMKEKAARLNRDGLALFNSGKYADALGLFIEAARVDPEEAEYANNSGNCRLRLREARLALKDFEKAVTLEPDRPLYRFNLGLAHMHLNEPEKAAGRFNEAVRLDDDFAPAWAHLGLVYYHGKKLKEAESAWEKAAALEKNAEVENNLGMVCMERGELDRAEKRFRRAIEIDGNFILSHYNLGVLYQKRNDSARAEKAYSSAIALDPAHFTAYYNRALVQLAQGKDREAITSLELFIKHCPPTLVQPLADARSRLSELRKNRLH